MRLNKEQRYILARLFTERANKPHDDEVKRREKVKKEAWDNSPIGKMIDALPKNFRDYINTNRYFIQNTQQYKGITDRLKFPPLPKKINWREVEEQMILASIDAKDMAELERRLEQHFK